MLNELIYKEIKPEGVHKARVLGLILYGTLSYILGVAGLCLLILACAGVVPLAMLFDMQLPPTIALLFNFGLLILFGVQHSLLARPAIKEKLYLVLPKSIERSTYVWTSGAMLAICVIFWQPVSHIIVWQLEGLGFWGVLAISGLGWGYLLAATFAINHWDLFGLRQIWLDATGAEYSSVSFKEHWMYRYSRHPIMLGVLIGIWCLPLMSVNQLLLNTGLSIYMLIGLYFEERDLIRHWGQGYIDYKKRVGALLSWPK